MNRVTFLLITVVVLGVSTHVSASGESPRKRQAIRDKLLKQNRVQKRVVTEEDRISSAVEKLTPREQKIFHRVRQAFSDFYEKDAGEHPEFHARLAQLRTAIMRRSLILRTRGTRKEVKEYNHLRKEFLGRFESFMHQRFPSTEGWESWEAWRVTGWRLRPKNGLHQKESDRTIGIVVDSIRAFDEEDEELRLYVRFGYRENPRKFDVAVKFEGDKGSTIVPWRYDRGPLSDVVDSKDRQVCQLRHSTLELKVKDLADDVASFLKGGDLSPRHRLELDGVESGWIDDFRDRKFEEMVGEAFANPRLCQDYRRSNEYDWLKYTYDKAVSDEFKDEFRRRRSNAGK